MPILNFGAIYVMWLREMKRFFRAKSRILSTLATPLFFLFALGFGLRSVQFGGAFAETAYLPFLTPGIIGMTILFNSMFAGLSILWDREFGFLKEILVAPIRRSTIVLGQISGGVTTTIFQAFAILIISFIFGFPFRSPGSIILALLIMALISIGFIGVSIAFASRMNDPHGFPLIMQFFTMPIFIFSGVLFPISNFPAWLQPIALINPLSYGVDALRIVLLGTGQFSLWLDLAVLGGFGLVTVFLGAFLFSRTEV